MFWIVMAAVALGVTAAWCSAYALVGRSSFPARERLPLRHWTVDDVHRNARRGQAQLVDLLATRHGCARPR